MTEKMWILHSTQDNNGIFIYSVCYYIMLTFYYFVPALLDFFRTLLLLSFLSPTLSNTHTFTHWHKHTPLVSCLQSGGCHYVLLGCQGWCAWWRLPSSSLHCSVSGPYLCHPLCWCPGTGLVLASAEHWNTKPETKNIRTNGGAAYSYSTDRVMMNSEAAAEENGNLLGLNDFCLNVGDREFIYYTFFPSLHPSLCVCVAFQRYNRRLHQPCRDTRQ